MQAPSPHPGLRFAGRMAAILVLAVPALAQTNPLPARTEVLQIDSGSAANTGARPQTVLALHVSQPGASWMRLSFSEVQLSGSVAAGTGSFLRITSLEDGHFQLLNAQTIESVSEPRRFRGRLAG